MKQYFSRRVLSGEFPVVNHHLMKDLADLGLWDEDMKNEIMANEGSVQVGAASIYISYFFHPVSFICFLKDM